MPEEEKHEEYRYFSGQWLNVRMPSCHDEIESLFEELIHRTWGRAEWRPEMDVAETTDAFVIEADLPGVNPDAIQVRADSRRVTIEGERRQSDALRGGRAHLMERPTGRFSRTFEFSIRIDAEKIHKQYTHGVLSLTIQKAKTR